MPEISMGRLLCVGIRGARPGDSLLEADLDACARAGVGGVILFDVDVPTMLRAEARGVPLEGARELATRNIIDPQQLRTLIDHLRARLGDEVLVCVDQEGGRVARLTPERGFAPDPSASEFARSSKSKREAAARSQAQQLRELGFDLNFAPCVDLAIEPANEIIVGRQRAFGRDARDVIEAARVVLDAHAEAGVAACLKHFPGHGSSRGDTHLGLVEITECWRREEELEPYRALCNSPGVAVMVAHLLHRALDAQQPASLSPVFIEELLRGELGFDGVVFTDSIDMGAIRERYTPGQAAVAAIDAGTDMVVDAFNLEDRDEHPAMALADALRHALAEGRIRGGQERIDRSLARLNSLREAFLP